MSAPPRSRSHFEPHPCAHEQADADHIDPALEASDGVVFIAADMPPGQPYQPGQNIAMSLSGGYAEQLLTYWSKLSSARKVFGATGGAAVGR